VCVLVCVAMPCLSFPFLSPNAHHPAHDSLSLQVERQVHGSMAAFNADVRKIETNCAQFCGTSHPHVVVAASQLREKFNAMLATLSAAGLCDATTSEVHVRSYVLLSLSLSLFLSLSPSSLAHNSSITQFIVRTCTPSLHTTHSERAPMRAVRAPMRRSSCVSRGASLTFSRGARIFRAASSSTCFDSDSTVVPT